jgi:Transmembrane amino acid transporter protein
MPGTTFITQVNGFGQSIFAYGGAMLFVEFMAEMRQPFDFWKGMIFAQIFIYFCYMLFGLFVYSFQGQYTLAIAFQGIGSYTAQTVCNSISLVSGIIAALLYGNIGLKVIYNNVLQDLLGFPGIDTKKGKVLWAGLIPVYWAVAFVIASAIPQVANLTAFLAALCILQFSYTFPSMMAFGFFAQRDAIDEAAGEGFNPATGQTVRHTTGVRRFLRGFMKKPLFNAWNVFLFLAYLCCAILGLYSSIVGMQIQYSTGVGVSFSCDSPLG